MKPQEKERWDSLMADAVVKAENLHREKSEDYGHFSNYPTVALASLCLVKAKRLLELAVRRENGQDPRFEPMQDSAIDLLNYAKFIYAKTEAEK